MTLEGFQADLLPCHPDGVVGVGLLRRHGENDVASVGQDDGHRERDFAVGAGEVAQPVRIVDASVKADIARKCALHTFACRTDEKRTLSR